MKKTTTTLLLLWISILFSYAQVTIVSGHMPVRGALLDLKEENTASGGKNSTKGLLLPRVVLDTEKPEIGKLANSINSTGVWDEDKHVGLLVYNIKNTLDACAGGAHVGVYSWDGRAWTSLLKVKTAPPTTEISIDEFDGANSYIVAPSSTVSIPMKRAFDIWNAYQGNSPSTGKVLDLATQWHIWVTKDKPLKNALPYTINGKIDWYMDRFLGAFSYDPVTKEAGKWPVLSTGGTVLDICVLEK